MPIKYLHRKVGRNLKWKQHKDPWFDPTCFKYWTEWRVELDWCILQLMFSSSTGILKLLSKNMSCLMFINPINWLAAFSYLPIPAGCPNGAPIIWLPGMIHCGWSWYPKVWTRFGGVLRSLNRFENRWTERRKLEEYEVA